MSSKLSRNLCALIFLILSASAVSAEDRVLIVGDSHIAGGLGQTLHENFQEALVPVSSYGLVGANPANLIPGKTKGLKLGATFRERGKAPKYFPRGIVKNLPSLKERIEAEKPSHVIFEFGDNLAGYRELHDHNIDVNGKGLRKLIQQQTQMVLEVLQGGSPKPACFWITPNWGPSPPKKDYWKTDSRLKQVIEAIKTSLAGKCTVIDSTTLVKRAEVPTNDDGLHYTNKAYRNWGNSVYSEILKKMTQPKSQASPCPTCGEN